MMKSMSRILTLLVLTGTQVHAGANVSLPMMGHGIAPVVPAIGGTNLQIPTLTPMIPQVVLPAIAIAPVAPAVGINKTLLNIEATLPQQPMGNVPVGQAYGSGARMNDAVTGENTVSGSAEVPAGDGNGNLPTPPSLSERVTKAKGVTDKIRNEVAKVIVGQREMVDSIIMAMVLREHVLLEGYPGVAKTETAKAFAASVDTKYQRVQGTADTEPSMITGSRILQTNLKTGEREFVTKKGPVFTNILLMDEINRMPPKTQSAVMEAMAESQVTIEDETHKLEHLTVIATQNPIEQDGTFPLPEAQQDRFMFKVVVPQPSKEEMRLIADRNESIEARPSADKVTNLAELDEVRRVSNDVYMDDDIKNYIEDLAMAPAKKDTKIGENVNYAVYTRAIIKLRKASRMHALMAGRDHVLPSDVQAVFPLIMRHRISISYSETSVEALIAKILETVPVPQVKAKP